MADTNINDRAQLAERLEQTLIMMEQVYKDTGAIGHQFLDIIRRMIEELREEERVYTAADVAKEANITKMSVINAIKANQLKATKIGVQWLITEADKNEYLATRRKPGRPKTK